MCGIVAAIAQRNVTNILLEGLRRLEYRGYDSAGVAIVYREKVYREKGDKGEADKGQLLIRKQAGKVSNLEQTLQQQPAEGHLGIAHTRWATHGKPTQPNAHPHYSDNIALVHNGIIENHSDLKQELEQDGYPFSSDTDSEVLAHLIHRFVKQGKTLLDAVQASVERCEGAYALAVVDANHPDQLVVTREGSPLVIGLGIDENFIASDQLALRQVTDRFIYLEEGDIAEITVNSIRIFDRDKQPVSREQEQLSGNEQSASRGQYRHK